MPSFRLTEGQIIFWADNLHGNPSYFQQRSLSFSSFQDCRQFTDVRIHCRDGEVEAHKPVLLLSRVVDEYFRDAHCPCTDLDIFFLDVSVKSMEIVMKLIYEGKVDFEDKNSRLHNEVTSIIKNLGIDADVDIVESQINSECQMMSESMQDEPPTENPTIVPELGSGDLSFDDDLSTFDFGPELHSESMLGSLTSGPDAQKVSDLQNPQPEPEASDFEPDRRSEPLQGTSYSVNPFESSSLLEPASKEREASRSESSFSEPTTTLRTPRRRTWSWVTEPMREYERKRAEKRSRQNLESGNTMTIEEDRFKSPDGVAIASTQSSRPKTESDHLSFDEDIIMGGDEAQVDLADRSQTEVTPAKPAVDYTIPRFYNCQHCNKRFFVTFALKKHIEKEHIEKENIEKEENCHPKKSVQPETYAKSDEVEDVAKISTNKDEQMIESLSAKISTNKDEQTVESQMAKISTNKDEQMIESKLVENSRKDVDEQMTETRKTQHNIEHQIDQPNSDKSTKTEKISKKCSICLRRFEIRPHLIRHFALVHFKDKILNEFGPFEDLTCKICQKKLADESGVITHLAMVHKVVEPHLRDLSQFNPIVSRGEVSAKSGQRIASVAANTSQVSLQASATLSPRIARVAAKPTKPESFVCVICSKKLPHHRGIITHYAWRHFKNNVVSKKSLCPPDCPKFRCQTIDKIIHLAVDHGALQGLIPEEQLVNKTVAPSTATSQKRCSSRTPKKLDGNANKRHPFESQSVTCKYCLKVFEKIGSHYKFCQMRKIKLKISTQQVESRIVDASGTSYGCHLCPETRKSAQMLTWHLAWIHFKEEIIGQYWLDENTKICTLCEEPKGTLQNTIIHIAERHNALKDLVPEHVYETLTKRETAGEKVVKKKKKTSTKISKPIADKT